MRPWGDCVDGWVTPGGNELFVASVSTRARLIRTGFHGMNARTMRSKLFVPASRPELFEKALASQADAISIDLEDSVVESRKEEARREAAEFLSSAAARASDKLILVRVNALDTPHFSPDVAAMVAAGVGMLNLPKAQSAADVHNAVAVIERAEAVQRIDKSVKLLVNIETPTGLAAAAQIAAASPRVAGLQLGFADLFVPWGIDRRDTANVHAAMFAVRMAAAQAGVFAYDGAFADIRDPQGFQAEAQMARRLGFWGKSCIHPSQIALANEVFRPDEADVAHAHRVLQASREAGARGVGAFLVNGKMIDAPMLRRAEYILALSARQAQR
jgi:citrate lyase subunit beta/citryl-CoA lyase